MRPRRRHFLIAALALSISPSAAPAVVAFDGTGAELFADAATSFPTGTPNVVGDALDLPAAVADEVLLVHPLADALTFGASDEVFVTFTLTLNRQSDDFDPVFLVTDGVDAVGGQVGDNPNGSARLIDGTLSGDTLVGESSPEIFNNAGFPAIGGTVDATVEIALGSAASEVRVTFLAGDATAPSTKVLDRTAELSFLVVANTALPTGELYRIEAATLEIEVPEPTAPILLTVGAMVLAGAARKRSARPA